MTRAEAIDAIVGAWLPRDSKFCGGSEVVSLTNGRARSPRRTRRQARKMLRKANKP